ncbi:alpha/beta hydrolase [Streptomyces sp. NRRL F-4489]|uniref:alpha/beta hydrolase n=1 Tax=Streptomyces sp. NRRL F-4489 TaxID=1609095 RepID=UPI00131C493E|nr:alpha/beta hydrolase [Streptomyces sp. NRRL F-4489]
MSTNRVDPATLRAAATHGEEMHSGLVTSLSRLDAAHQGLPGGAAGFEYTDFGKFLDGIQTTHQGDRPHVTAIGHSYGSFTLGQAAQREGGIPVDDIILVGSPGTGADKAADLGLSPDHVWAGAAESDPITHLPSKSEVGFGVVGGQFGAGIAHLADPHELWFGQDPASAEFGGNRFSVDFGIPPNSHSDYFDEEDGSGGESLRNMGRIVSGHPEKVTRQGAR